MLVKPPSQVSPSLELKYDDYHCSPPLLDKKSTLPTLSLVDFRRFKSQAERTALVSLQGLVNKAGPLMWMDNIGLNHHILPLLEADHWQIEDLRDLSLAALIEKFRAHIDGAILYDYASINLATSFAGVQSSLLLKEPLFNELSALKWPLRADARSATYRDLYVRFSEQISQERLVEQRPQHATFLRDFAIKNNLLTYYDVPQSTLRDITGGSFSPMAQVFGWGTDEYAWVHDLSNYGAIAVPTEYFLNLSLLPCLGTKIPPAPRPEPLLRAEDPELTLVAFVLTDGDNISWMVSDFVDDPHFWASPLRGTLPFTWEIGPNLAMLAPYYLKYFYQHARTGAYGDSFVAGMGLGYTFPSKNPQRLAYATATAELMAASHLSILSLLDDQGSVEDAEIFLRQPGIDAVLYKNFSRYDQQKGAIAWAHNKPAIAFKFLLWEGLPPQAQAFAGPEDISAQIAALPARHRSDSASYAVVGVHAWSFRDSGGPLQAVKETIAKLPKTVKVVSVGELIAQLRENFAPVR